MLVEEKIIAEKNNVVTLSYELHVSDKNGEMIEQVTERKPFSFIFGSGALLKSFEEKLKGLKSGDTFEFILKSEEAYGEKDNSNIVDIPISTFANKGKIDYELLKIGNTIPLRDQAGNHFNAEVLEINEESVKMDLNHPLAGKDLYFAGKITDIREASEEELQHGHIHEHKHQHDEEGCGCGSGCGCH